MSKVWFITGATRGIGAEIAKAALAASDQVVATGRQPERVTKALGTLDNLFVTALDVTREDTRPKSRCRRPSDISDA